MSYDKSKKEVVDKLKGIVDCPICATFTFDLECGECNDTGKIHISRLAIAELVVEDIWDDWRIHMESIRQ